MKMIVFFICFAGFSFKLFFGTINHECFQVCNGIFLDGLGTLSYVRLPNASAKAMQPFTYWTLNQNSTSKTEKHMILVIENNRELVLQLDFLFFHLNRFLVLPFLFIFYMVFFSRLCDMCFQHSDVSLPFYDWSCYYELEHI